MANKRLSCITYPITPLYSAIVVTFLPLIIIEPRRTKFLANCLPESKFSIVVLPHPDGPNMAVTVLGENFPEQSFKIVLTAFSLRKPPLPLGVYF